MLHGYTQSGPLFHAKTRALEKNLRKAFPPAHYDVSLHYPSGPVQILAPDVSSHTPDDRSAATSAEESYGWFQRKDAQGVDSWYQRLEEGFATVADVMRREGPFDGVVGFSQGGYMAGAVASLLEEGRREIFENAREKGGMEYPSSFLRGNGGAVEVSEEMQQEKEREDGVFHPPMRFAVSYSGFAAHPNPLYQAFIEPKIRTPLLHFIGSVDTVVDESRTMRLVDSTEPGRDSEEGKKRIVFHPGGHFLPASQRQCLIPLLGFIRETMGWDELGKDAPMGKRAQEDLDLPF